MIEETIIEIGDNFCFVAKDNLGIQKISLTVHNEEDIDFIGDLFNKTAILKVFRGDTIKQAEKHANEFINEVLQEKAEKFRFSMPDPNNPKILNPPGLNSFTIDKQGNPVQVVPEHMLH